MCHKFLVLTVKMVKMGIYYQSCCKIITSIPLFGATLCVHDCSLSVLLLNVVVCSHMHKLVHLLTLYVVHAMVIVICMVICISPFNGFLDQELITYRYVRETSSA